MKRACLLLIVCLVSVLTFAQTNWPTLSPTSPVAVPYGDQPQYFGASKVFAVDNGSATEMITISSVSTGNPPTFFVYNDACTGTTLMPGTACNVTVVFFGSALNMQESDTLTVISSNGTVQTPITARAISPEVTLSPINCHISTLRFPCRISLWATLGPVTLTLTNNRGTTLTVDSIVANPTGYFTILPTGTCPFMTMGTVPPHGSCTINVEYTGNPLQHTNGELTVTDNAADATPYYIELCHKPICNPPALALGVPNETTIK